MENKDPFAVGTYVVCTISKTIGVVTRPRIAREDFVYVKMITSGYEGARGTLFLKIIDEKEAIVRLLKCK